MKVITNLDDFFINEKTAVAIGYFDGFHIGHRKVLNTVLQYKKKGYKVCLFSFSIDTSLPKNKSKDLITTPSDKAKLAKLLGVDYLVTPNFDDIKNLSPDDFLEKIIKTKLNAKAVACGDDFRFGKKAEGNTDILERFCQKNGINLNIITPARIGDEIISSTKIREFLYEGRVDKASEFLGRPYSYNLLVNRGRKIGRTLDFPTINQHFEKNQLLPKFGVYTGVVEIENKLYAGAVNIGIIPTIRVEIPVSETHIVGFAGNLYEKKVRVGLIKFLRSEIKFENKLALQNRIILDTKEIVTGFNIWYNSTSTKKTTIFY